MLVLWMFGRELEYRWGKRNFLIYYFITGIGSGLVTMIFNPLSLTPVVGASGAIYGILTGYTLLYPSRQVYIYGIFPIQIKYMMIFLGITAFIASIANNNSTISHLTHLSGMIIGFLYLKKNLIKNYIPKIKIHDNDLKSSTKNNSMEVAGWTLHRGADGRSLLSGSNITLDAEADIILDADGADIIFKDAGTSIATFTNSSTDFIIESATSDKDIIFKVNDGGSSTEVARFDGDVSALLMASGKKIMLGAAEETISGDGTDITFEVGSSGDINIPANIGLTFGDDGEKIEGDGTDLTITGNNINLTATADVVIPANVGITFGSGEKIEGDSTDLTITSGAKINLTATTDVHVPNNVGIVFGGDSEKIEGDGTDMTISANNLTVDAAADIVLDAAGNNVTFKSGGTSILDISNSSSDAVITSSVQDKDIIFKGDDGGSAVTALTMDMSAGGTSIFGAAAFNQEATLTDASTISWDVAASPVAKVTLGANRTLGAGSNAVAGQFVSLLVIQDGTGSRTLSFNAAYEFTADTAPTLTTTASKGDLFVFRYNGSKFLEVGRNLNLTLS